MEPVLVSISVHRMTQGISDWIVKVVTTHPSNKVTITRDTPLSPMKILVSSVVPVPDLYAEAFAFVQPVQAVPGDVT